MQCPSCDYIYFRPAKKCPSCNAGLARAQFAQQPDEEFTIYASSGAGTMGAMDMDGDDFGDIGEMGADVMGDTMTDVGEDDFALDLADAMPEEEPVEAAVAEPELAAEDDNLNFELGSSDVSDVDMDGLGLDFESETEEPELDLGTDDSDDDSGIELDLGGDDDSGIELDLGDDDDTDSGLELNLDDEPEVALDLGGDEEPEVELDLGGDDEPEVELDLGDDTAGDEPELDLGGDDDEPSLELDGLEMDLTLDDDDEEEKPA